jgi:hypothetical protein
MLIGNEDLRSALDALGECASVDGRPIRALVRRGPVLDDGLVEGDAFYLLSVPADVEAARKGSTVTCAAGEFRVRRKMLDGSGLARLELSTRVEGSG